MDHEPPEGAAVVARSENPVPCAPGQAAPEVTVPRTAIVFRSFCVGASRAASPDILELRLCSCAGRIRRLPVACLASVPYDSQTNTACMPQLVAYQLVDPLLESMAAQSAAGDLEGCVAYHALNSASVPTSVRHRDGESLDSTGRPLTSQSSASHCQTRTQSTRSSCG
jgi:hypothetical protein